MLSVSERASLCIEGHSAIRFSGVNVSERKQCLGEDDGQPFRNPMNEGLATSLAIVHVAFRLSLGYNVGTFLH
jgi:hypothetical protein